MVKFGWLCSHESYQPEELISQAVLAEEAGFDLILGSDHFHPWVDIGSASGFVWTWLGAVAERVSTELATSVTCPIYHYHPGLVAQAAATVDRLSDGRFLLGIGTGENINEGPLGFEFGDYRERIGRMREAIEVMRRLFDGEKLDFEGNFFRTEKAKLYSPPVGSVPIVMAAGGPQSATFAGRRTDGLICSVKDTWESLQKVITPFRKASSENGNRGIVIATRWVVFASNDDEAWRALGSMRGLRAEGRLNAVDPMVLRERADSMPRGEILDKYLVVDSVEKLVAAYRPLVADLDADYISIQIASLQVSRVLEMLRTEVLPELRRLAEG